MGDEQLPAELQLKVGAGYSIPSCRVEVGLWGSLHGPWQLQQLIQLCFLHNTISAGVFLHA